MYFVGLDHILKIIVYASLPTMLSSSLRWPCLQTRLNKNWRKHCGQREWMKISRVVKHRRSIAGMYTGHKVGCRSSSRSCWNQRNCLPVIRAWSRSELVMCSSNLPSRSAESRRRRALVHGTNTIWVSCQCHSVTPMKAVVGDSHGRDVHCEWKNLDFDKDSDLCKACSGPVRCFFFRPGGCCFPEEGYENKFKQD